MQVQNGLRLFPGSHMAPVSTYLPMLRQPPHREAGLSFVTISSPQSITANRIPTTQHTTPNLSPGRLLPPTRLLTILHRRQTRRVKRAQDSDSPIPVYVHNVNVEDNRTRLLYTAWQDGEPINAVDAVAVFSDAIDDREMSVRMGHVVEVTKGEIIKQG